MQHVSKECDIPVWKLSRYFLQEAIALQKMNKGIDMIFSKEYCNCALAIAFVWQECYRLKLNTPHTVQDVRLLKGYPLKEDWICWQKDSTSNISPFWGNAPYISLFSRHTASWRKACLKGRPPLVNEKSLSLNLKCSFKKSGIFHVCVEYCDFSTGSLYAQERQNSLKGRLHFLKIKHCTFWGHASCFHRCWPGRLLSHSYFKNL